MEQSLTEISFDLLSFEGKPEAEIITFEDQYNGEYVEFD
jgi:hypothetical protein